MLIMVLKGTDSFQHANAINVNLSLEIEHAPNDAFHFLLSPLTRCQCLLLKEQRVTHNLSKWMTFSHTKTVYKMHSDDILSRINVNIKFINPQNLYGG